MARDGRLGSFSTSGELTLNVPAVQTDVVAFLGGEVVALVDLLIHEFAHGDAAGHLSEAFDKNMSRLGAQAVEADRARPSMFRTRQPTRECGDAEVCYS